MLTDGPLNLPRGTAKNNKNNEKRKTKTKLAQKKIRPRLRRQPWGQTTDYSGKDL